MGEVDSFQSAGAHETWTTRMGAPATSASLYRPVRRLGLDGLGTGEGVEAGCRIAASERLLLQLGDGVAVLGVDHDQNPGVFGELQHLEEVFVLGVERCSLVGHEDLDRGDALLGEVGQLGLYVVAQVGYGDVETVVDYGFVPRLLGPGVEGPGQGAARFLQGEVDDHGRPAGSRGLRPRSPVVRRHGTPEGHVHVGMGVYKAGHDELARGVYGLGAVRVQVRRDRNDLPVLNEHVCPVAAFRGYDRSPTK